MKGDQEMYEAGSVRFVKNFEKGHFVDLPQIMPVCNQGWGGCCTWAKGVFATRKWKRNGLIILSIMVLKMKII